MSSAYFPPSNGRAEAHANGKVGPSGSLNNDGLLRALLHASNTPDPDCNISPAHVVFGRPIRGAFSFISRYIKYNTPSIRPTWCETWPQTEDAMRASMPRSTEVLDMHTRPLAPILLGDKVFLHKPATVVELGNYDQYWVKFMASIIEEQAFLAEMRPTITDYW